MMKWLLFGGLAFVFAVELAKPTPQSITLYYADQEHVGRIIVMVASGWDRWPDRPECTYDTTGKFTNIPCRYGGMTFEHEHRITIQEEVPSWLWKIAR